MSKRKAQWLGVISGRHRWVGRRIIKPSLGKLKAFVHNESTMGTTVGTIKFSRVGSVSSRAM